VGKPDEKGSLGRKNIDGWMILRGILEMQDWI
jgi:hypothetical protein